MLAGSIGRRGGIGMQDIDIGELIEGGESETVEFKEAFDKETIETVVAFANTFGGTILIGVTDLGKTKHITLGRRTIIVWANQISQGTDPRIAPDVEPIMVRGKHIVIVRVKKSPVGAISTSGRCFRRVGCSNRRMTPYEIAELHLQSKGTSWDKLPAKDYRIEELDKQRVRSYIRKANEVGRRSIPAGQTLDQILKKLEFVEEGRPTWAGLLLFRKEPRKLSLSASMHCGRFKKEIIVVDDRMIEGPVLDQVEEAMDFVRKNTNVEFVMTGRPQREEVWDYPLDAVREAIINAIIHRDYSLPSLNEVRIYDDRLVVSSPGELPMGMSLERLLGPHDSVPRNKGLAKAFYDLGLIEHWGGGIDKIVTECKDAGLPPPSFTEDYSFKVTFWKETYAEPHLRALGLNERQIKTIDHLKGIESLSNMGYQRLFDVSRRTSARELDEMVTAGVLERHGARGRSSNYRLRIRKKAERIGLEQ
jgi:ATP-dependent DNA helicase RecG